MTSWGHGSAGAVLRPHLPSIDPARDTRLNLPRSEWSQWAKRGGVVRLEARCWGLFVSILV